MDSEIANNLAASLLGSTVGGWQIRQYLNHGKSAVIFLADKDGVPAALKIFDPQIVQRYGPDVQRARIARERSLIGKTHPNLVAIYDGGEDGSFFFVAMEYFQGKNLAEVLHLVPQTSVRGLISQVASAAQFLEDLSFAHRDIKPENIGIAPDMKLAKLLDLGVIRPFDLSNITDEGDQRSFIGTLRYSPPEMLFREEDQSVDAWRAITFYQLGAVLHDLLMRKPLFDSFTSPYARLVRAVEQEIPRVDALDADADLRLLAQNCLAKVPSQRLDTVKWEDFSQTKVADPMDAARRTIAQHRLAASQERSRPLSSPDDRLANQLFVLRTSIHSALVSTCKVENLSRYSLRETNRDHAPMLRTLFQPVARDGLSHYLAIYCEGQVLDPTANLQQLRLWAYVSATFEEVPEQPDSAANCDSLMGTLIEQDVRVRVQQFLLLAYAAALDVPRENRQPIWLNIGVAS